MIISLLLNLCSFAWSGDSGRDARAMITLHQAMPSRELTLWLPEGVELEFNQNQLAVLKTPVTARASLERQILGIPGVRSLAWDRDLEVDLKVSENLGFPDPLWPQHQTGIDLMHLEQKRISAKPTRVVVLGSGIQVDWQHSLMSEATLQFKQSGLAIQKIRDPWLYALGGAHGVGSTPDSELVIYPVVKEGAQGPSQLTGVVVALERACEENPEPHGVTVISVGWGSSSWRHVSGFSDLLKDLATRGCLVVQSTGEYNVGFREQSEFLPSVRVGPSGPTGRGDFFAETDLYAPNVVTAGKFQSLHGAGIAAQWVAGVVVETQRLLMDSPKYWALSPIRRIVLIKQILDKSAFSGFVNGLRAIRVAHHWVQSGETATALASGHECDASDRKALFLCDDPSGELAKRVFEASVKNSDWSAAVFALGRIKSSPSSGAVLKLAHSLDQSSLDPKTVEVFLPHLLEAIKDQPSRHQLDLARKWLRHSPESREPASLAP